MAKSIVIAASCVVLAVSLGCSPEGGASMAPSVSPAELQAQLVSGSAPLVLDVRSTAEYEGGHVPGAIHIPFDQVGDRIAEIDASKGVAVYCGVGPRARKGEAALLAAGYDEVFHVEGGFTAWKAAGLPIEGGP